MARPDCGSLQLYDMRTVATQSRQFLIRVVRFLAGEAGVRQFLDIGTGLPTMPNTHEVAQSITARVLSAAASDLRYNMCCTLIVSGDEVWRGDSGRVAASGGSDARYRSPHSGQLVAFFLGVEARRNRPGSSNPG